jgi:NAD(P)-dependent dehydrogenase (short-subunit alcohol dehydrogenase family)
VIRIAVIDGQGAGIGAAIIREIRQAHGETVEIWALGTNAVATSQMMKVGANRGATGESAICHCVHQVDVITGPISIIIANAMMGEVSPAMALATGSSKAIKLLLPLTLEPVMIVGVSSTPLPHLVDKLVNEYLAAVMKGNGLPHIRIQNRSQSPSIDGEKFVRHLRV